jgi:hypothetical protein
MNKINIKNLFRLSQDKQIRPLTFLLANKSKEIIGLMNNFANVVYHPQLSSADELSFSVYKLLNGEECNYWDKIINFKLLYVKEYNEWFEITVDVDDSQDSTIKNITATSLCEAELSHILMDTTEINTEADIARKDYITPTIFYDPDNPSSSLLDRVILKKMPNYSIAYVDDTLWDIQRTFTFDNTTSVYDAMKTIAEEIGCLFLFDTNERSIYAYDLEYMCLDCNYRSDYEFKVCPNCGGTLHIHKPYGYDTNIYIDKEQLGQNINLTSDEDNVKNCVKIYGGDEIINAAIRNANPNGTNYIYAFDDDTLADMPNTLVDKLEEYNDTIEEYKHNKIYDFNSDMVNNYNSVVEKIASIYPSTEFTNMSNPIVGYINIMARYYECIDLDLYLRSSMMPVPSSEEKTAQSEGEKIENELTTVGVGDVSSISLATADSSVLLMAKAIIDTSLYKVVVTENSSSILSQTWSGSFTLTSYAKDEEGVPKDSYTTTVIDVELTDDMTEYLNQKIEKIVAKLDLQGVKDIFKIEDLDEFKTEIKKYSYNMLNSYLSAYQSALDVLTQQGISEPNNALYNELYIPYYERFKALESEMNIRSYDIECVNDIMVVLEDYINSAHYTLNFENYLGPELYNLFLVYRREDSYDNSNYVSDGLNNSEIFKLVDNLIQVATESVMRSAQTQYSVSTTLLNLMLILGEDRQQIYENFLENFILGNYIRVKIDGSLYKMRMGDVTIDYNNLNNLSMTFYDTSKSSVSTTISRAKQLLEQTKSMSASFNLVKKQAEQGERADRTFDVLKQDGLDLAQYMLFSTNSDVVFDEHGLLARNYDDVKEQYNDEQLRLNGNSIILTDDNWLTTRMAIGKQFYYLDSLSYEEYGLNADFVLAGKIIGGDIYSQNYLTTDGEISQGTHINLNDGTFAFAGGKLSYDLNKLYVEGTIESIDGHIGGWTIANGVLNSNNGSIVLDANNNKIYSGTHSSLSSTSNGYYLAADGLSIGDSFSVTSAGYLSATEGLIGGWNINSTTLKSTSNTIVLDGGNNKIYSGSHSTLSSTSNGYYLAANGLSIGSHFSATSTGAITATSVDLTGKITATSGKIAGYTINGDKLYGSQVGMDAESGGDYAFWAGASVGNSGSAPYRVGHDGSLYSSSATITGSITATSGKIGGWNISGGALIGTDIGLDSNNQASHAIWAGNSNQWDAPFRVGHNGGLYASSAIISGDITATSGWIDGSIVASGINADNITAGTINSDRIDANTIVARGIDSVNINASNITYGTMSGDRIEAGSITANQLTVNEGYTYLNDGLWLEGERCYLLTDYIMFGYVGTMIKCTDLQPKLEKLVRGGYD